MEMMVWNVVLSAVVAVMGFLLKSKFDELSRLGILLNRTREEVARDHITRWNSVRTCNSCSIESIGLSARSTTSNRPHMSAINWR